MMFDPLGVKREIGSTVTLRPQVELLPMCAVCLSGMASTVLPQCGHAALCTICSREIDAVKACPICRARSLSNTVVSLPIYGVENIEYLGDYADGTCILSTATCIKCAKHAVPTVGANECDHISLCEQCSGETSQTTCGIGGCTAPKNNR